MTYNNSDWNVEQDFRPNKYLTRTINILILINIYKNYNEIIRYDY